MKRITSVFLALIMLTSCLAAETAVFADESVAVEVTVDGVASEDIGYEDNGKIDSSDCGLSGDARSYYFSYGDTERAVSSWEISGLTEGTDYNYIVKSRRIMIVAVLNSVPELNVNAVTEENTFPNKVDIYENDSETPSKSFEMDCYGKVTGYNISEEMGGIDLEIINKSYFYFIKLTDGRNVSQWSIAGLTENSDYYIIEKNATNFLFIINEAYNGIISIDATVECPHSWGDPVVTKEPTCGAEGTADVTCEICGITQSVPVPPTLMHTWGDPVVISAPTCSKKGKDEYTCTECGGKKIEETGYNNVHSFGEPVIDKAPDCVNVGVAHYYCKDCGFEQCEPIAATGIHAPVTDAAVPATFKTEGKTKGTHCSVCGEIIVEQKAVPKLGAPALSKVKRGKKAFTVTWKTVKSIEGYQIQYSRKKSMKGAKIKTVKGASNAKLTVKKLKKGKRYYVRIRAYKTIGGVKKYSGWSAKKSVKTK